jgi:hypothetical protein
MIIKGRYAFAAYGGSFIALISKNELKYAVYKGIA